MSAMPTFQVYLVRPLHFICLTPGVAASTYTKLQWALASGSRSMCCSNVGLACRRALQRSWRCCLHNSCCDTTTEGFSLP